MIRVMRNRLFVARAELRIKTQREAAERAGVSLFRYRKLENEQDVPSLEEARALSAAFDVSIDVLFPAQHFEKRVS